MHHKKLQLESLEVFTIGNVVEKSKWYGSSLIFLSLYLTISFEIEITLECKKYTMLMLTSTCQAIAVW